MVETGLVISVGGLVIPLLNALFTKVSASDTLKTLVSIVLACATSAVAWATDLGVGASGKIEDLLLVALGAGLAAGGFKKAWLDQAEQKFRVVTGSFGVGSASKTELPRAA
jgi:hypothetical protein